MNKTIHVIGAASGIAANNSGCCMGPVVMQGSSYLSDTDLPLQWEDIIYPTSAERGLAAIEAVAGVCENIARYTFQATQDQEPFLVIGGDHSCAIGTWSGAAAAMRNKGPIGMIWIDAHMDSHTPETTHTGNLHGMPVSALLGHGASRLRDILYPGAKLSPQHMCMIGIRSYESEEAELLKRLNIKCYFMEDVKQRGLNAIMQEALALVKKGTVGYGISIDIDAIEPSEAPAVGVPEPDGLSATELNVSLKLLQNDTQLIGVEIVEFNPHLDQEQKTEKLVSEMVATIFAPTEK